MECEAERPDARYLVGEDAKAGVNLSADELERTLAGRLTGPD